MSWLINGTFTTSHIDGKSYFMIFFMLGRLDLKIVGMVGCAGGVVS